MSTDRIIACDFTAIEEEEREAHKQNAEQLFNAVENWKERPQGYAFKLPTNTRTVEKAGAFMARERLCCPFFHFNLEVTPDHGPVWLYITGTDEVKDYITQTVIPQLESTEDDDWDLPDESFAN